MTNKEVYKKTLVFSLRRFIFDFICVILLVGLAVGGFIIMEKLNDKGLIGLGIGAVLAIIIIAIAAHFFSYIFKAGQIAMMTRAYTEGSLPEDVYGEGKKIVKERFLTVAAFYAATRLIEGIFNQVGRGITAIGEAVGGDTGNAVGSAISVAINVVVGYLCDCCLGWVFYCKDKGAVKATINGAVIFFKNGKALLKNLGRMFGMGIVSLLLIGGAFTGINYLICSQFPDAFRTLGQEIASISSDVPAWVSDVNTLTIAVAAIIGLIFWGIVHSVFIRPFILAGVLKNYLEAAMKTNPTEADMAELDKVSSKFKKARQEM